MTTTNKTGRKYGEKTTQVMEIAKAKGRITALDLLPIAGNRILGVHILRYLAARGDIRLIEKAGIGRHGKPAVYGI